MEINEILERIDSAILTLLDKEFDILERGLNELNLSSHLTKYLTPLFENYTVDPEYNGDRLKSNDRKSLDIARRRMIDVGLNTSEDNNYQFTPDIIVHTRNIQENNLVVIEVKKDSNSKRNKNFDLIKLEHLTIDFSGNHYNYKLGIYIEFGTKKNAGNYSIQYFQNGIPLTKNKLK